MSPVTLLIAALGGEGGGVLTGWIVDAARRAGLPVQATSIPGVAQRTGATTYYTEIWPEALETLGDKAPVLALSPAAGEVNIMLASELLEAARAIQSGLVTPDRTTLIASTHRVLTTREKMAMGDGRFDSTRLMAAARERSADCRLADLDVVAKGADAPLSSVMLGALAATAKLPIDEGHFREAIRAGAKAVEANLRGFEAGLMMAEPVAPGPPDTQAAALEARIGESFPAELHETLGQAVARLTDYQDAAYADHYLDRLKPFAGGDAALLRAVARHLAVRMTYEDIFRVAQAKTILQAGFCRNPRRAAPGAGGMAQPSQGPARLGPPDATAHHDDLGPCKAAPAGGSAPLPPSFLAIRRGAGRHRKLAERNRPCHNARYRTRARDRRMRPSHQGLRRHAVQNFALIKQTLIAPALAGHTDPATTATRIAQAREAALSDPEGGALAEELAAPLEKAAE
jgi:indolepyruvate ferredoxin oxidoreductase beta subunit